MPSFSSPGTRNTKTIHISPQKVNFDLLQNVGLPLILDLRVHLFIVWRWQVLHEWFIVHVDRAVFWLQVGVIQYGSSVVHEFTLDEYQTVEDVVDAARRIDQRGGEETRTALGINVARYDTKLWPQTKLCWAHTNLPLNSYWSDTITHLLWATLRVSVIYSCWENGLNQSFLVYNLLNLPKLNQSEH